MQKNVVWAAPSSASPTRKPALRWTVPSRKEGYIDPEYGWSEREIPRNPPKRVTDHDGETAIRWLEQHAEEYRAASRHEVGQAVELLATIPSARDASISPQARVAAYEIALKGIPARFLRPAVEAALQTCQWMPSPVELRELCTKVGGSELAGFMHVTAIATAERFCPGADAAARTCIPPPPKVDPPARPPLTMTREQLDAYLASLPRPRRRGIRADPVVIGDAPRRTAEALAGYRLPDMTAEQVELELLAWQASTSTVR